MQDDAVRVFFHIREYQQAGRRPELGELVKYVASPVDGRWKATSVSRAIPRQEMPSASNGRPANSWRVPAWIQYVLLGSYVGGLSWAISDDRLPIEVLFVMFGASAITYMAYAFDKHAAQKRRQRIPETTLHLMELLSGWPGALLAQLSLRHKTSKRSYRIEFWAMTIANLAATGFWVTYR